MLLKPFFCHHTSIKYAVSSLRIKKNGHIFLVFLFVKNAKNIENNAHHFSNSSYTKLQKDTLRQEDLQRRMEFSQWYTKKCDED